MLLKEFQSCQKAAEATRKINDRYGPGTVNELTARRWFKKFREEDMGLEDKKLCGRPRADDDSALRKLIEEHPHEGTRSIAKKLRVDHSTVVRHLKQLRDGNARQTTKSALKHCRNHSSPGNSSYSSAGHGLRQTPRSCSSW
ncbi:hypothetical protein KIN20_038392 [Parelaphostrongylus tenuis]|uniref:Mos1 transposase HTH domain-containing protein n=1 Tax=Parelaphostrongylus tenuis TaxID=148309 RepID=A0AAD5MNY1_PARTN|nr:hypothetical protein KIN20_038392 [Parelaphostrongylus tenuis]